jgi:hypothetical protein
MLLFHWSLDIQYSYDFGPCNFAQIDDVDRIYYILRYDVFKNEGFLLYGQVTEIE